MIIRQISAADNKKMASILRKSLEEFNLNIPGTAYFDESTDNLYESFNINGAIYFVAEDNGTVIGGAGIFPTKGLPSDTVELVKMYIDSAERGKGVGKLLMNKCIESAKLLSYKNIYLETIPELNSAVSAYEKLGFKYLDKPLADTGHFSCNIWMILGL